jgi:hypothetical protein
MRAKMGALAECIEIVIEGLLLKEAAMLLRKAE